MVFSPLLFLPSVPAFLTTAFQAVLLYSSSFKPLAAGT
jgi:hypothetical protein